MIHIQGLVVVMVVVAVLMVVKNVLDRGILVYILSPLCLPYLRGDK